MLVFEKHQTDFCLGGGVQGLGRDNQNKYLCLQSDLNTELLLDAAGWAAVRILQA